MKYQQCAREYPHENHMNDDGTRCLGVPVRDDRERTFNPENTKRKKRNEP